MSGQCPLGNRGFPIIVTGASYDTIKKIQVVPNDIKLQFANTTISALDNETGNFDVAGSQTFWVGGIQHKLHTLRICRPAENGLEYTYFLGSNPVAEIHLWGVPTGNSNNSGLSVLIIPVYKLQTSVGSDEANKWLKIINNREGNLTDIFPQNQDGTVIRYSTCIEIPDGGNIGNINIRVCYWSKGIHVGSNTKLGTLAKFGVPASLTGNQILYNTVSEVGSKATRTLTSTAKSIENGVSAPYTTALSSTSQEFSQRFRKCVFSIEAMKVDSGPTQYKCIAIDRQKDIVNGQVMIDPKNGKRLGEALEQENQQELTLGKIPEAIITGGTIENGLTIFLGIVGGTLFLAIVVSLIIWLTTKRTAPQAAINAVAAASTAAMPAINWIDLVLPVFLGIVFTCVITIVVISFIKSTKT